MYNLQVQRWSIFLITSLLVNFWILSSIRLESTDSISYELPSIKVNLMSIAAPTKQFESTPTTQEQNRLESQQQSSSNSIVTTPKAKEKLEKMVEYEKLTAFQKKKKITQHKPKKIKKPLVSHTSEAQSNKIKAPKVASLEPNLGAKISNTIHEAKYRIQIPPIYPRRAFELGQEGTVILLAQVSLNGKPRVLEVEESSGHRLLDSAALAAVEKWEFEPVKVNEQSIVSWVRVPVRFVIQ